MTDTRTRRVVIASYLEPELVQRIAAAEPRIAVTYEPELLPRPRFPCDHHGEAPALAPDRLAHWEALVAEAEIMFDFDWHEPASLPERCPQLRWIQATSAGIGDFMDRTGLRHGALTVTTAGGIHAVPLAEFALAGALHFIKDVPQLADWQRAHAWELHTSRQLAGRRALVVGLGGIGRRVAAVFAGLGVEVWGLARRPDPAPLDGVTRFIEAEALRAELAHVEVLVLCCPLTPETEGLIGAAEIDALGPEAVVVNLARGPVIDEPALIEALRRRTILGACLDVFAHEPLPRDSPLWDLDNVIVSPHSASTVATENVALTELFLDNLGRYLDGRPLRNRYDSVAGY